MKTTLTTDTFTIALTEIAHDFDDAPQLELCFDAHLSRAYLATLDARENIFDLISDLDDTDTGLDFEFNVASRHDTGLYYIIKSDRTGDIYDDAESIIYSFGQPVYDFIADICRLLNVPFCADAA
jgi:hypothetical protein